MRVIQTTVDEITTALRAAGFRKVTQSTAGFDILQTSDKRFVVMYVAGSDEVAKMSTHSHEMYEDALKTAGFEIEFDPDGGIIVSGKTKAAIA